MLVQGTLLYLLEVYPNSSKATMSPYTVYSFTSWFMWIAYGLGWGVWLANAFFDNKAGKIHWIFIITSRVMVAPPFF